MIVKIQEAGCQMSALEIDRFGVGGLGLSGGNLSDDSTFLHQQPCGERVRGFGVQQRRILEESAGQAAILTRQILSMSGQFATLVTSARRAQSRFV